MNRQRFPVWTALFLTMVIFVSLILFACAKPAPTTTPAPAPTTSAPSAAPKATTSAPATTSAAPAAKTITWRIAWWGAKGNWYINPMDYWAAEMEKRTQGRFKATITHGGALGTANEQLDNIGAGLFEMGPITASYTPGKVPLLNGANLPTLPPIDTKQIGLWTMAVHNNPELIKEMDKWGVVYIADHYVPTYNLLSTRPVRTVADLKGIKLAIASGLVAELLKPFGVTGVTMPGTEFYDSMQKGIIQAVMIGDYSLDSYKLHELGKYWTTGMAITSASQATIANKKAWLALPDDIKKIATDLRVETVNEWARQYDIAETSWLQKVKDYKVEAISFPLEERAKILAGAQPLMDKWVADMAAQGLPGKQVLDYMLAQRKQIAGY